MWKQCQEQCQTCPNCLMLDGTALRSGKNGKLPIQRTSGCLIIIFFFRPTSVQPLLVHIDLDGILIVTGRDFD